MFKDMETSIQKLEVTLTENAEPKETIRDTILVMNDLLPKMDDFYTRVLPILEDLKKLQRQAADQVCCYSREFYIVVERYYDHFLTLQLGVNPIRLFL